MIWKVSDEATTPYLGFTLRMGTMQFISTINLLMRNVPSTRLPFKVAGISCTARICPSVQYQCAAHLCGHMPGAPAKSNSLLHLCYQIGIKRRAIVQLTVFSIALRNVAENTP